MPRSLNRLSAPEPDFRHAMPVTVPRYFTLYRDAR